MQVFVIVNQEEVHQEEQTEKRLQLRVKIKLYTFMNRYNFLFCSYTIHRFRNSNMRFSWEPYGFQTGFHQN
jgi:hypothetical protein